MPTEQPMRQLCDSDPLADHEQLGQPEPFSHIQPSLLIAQHGQAAANGFLFSSSLPSRFDLQSPIFIKLAFVQGIRKISMSKRCCLVVVANDGAAMSHTSGSGIWNRRGCDRPPPPNARGTIAVVVRHLYTTSRTNISVAYRTHVSHIALNRGQASSRVSLRATVYRAQRYPSDITAVSEASGLWLEPLEASASLVGLRRGSGTAASRASLTLLRRRCTYRGDSRQRKSVLHPPV